jgi:hypothetical protein
MDPGGVTRVDSILDDELGRLLDRRLEPHGVESRLGHVGHLGWVRAVEPLGPNPQEPILVALVKVHLELIGTVCPRFAQLLLGVLPAVVRTLDVTVREHLAERQGRTTVLACIRQNLHVILVIAPHDIVLRVERDPAGLSPERRRTRQSDPALH